MPDLKKISDEADMIVNGFAYKKCEEENSKKDFYFGK